MRLPRVVSRSYLVPTTSSPTVVTSVRAIDGYRRHEEVDVHVLRPEGTTSDDDDEAPLHHAAA